MKRQKEFLKQWLCWAAFLLAVACFTGCKGNEPADDPCQPPVPGCPDYVDPCEPPVSGCPDYVDPCEPPVPGCENYVAPQLGISSFSPAGGKAGTELTIRGENFGTDISKIQVTVGGVKAIVISSTDTQIVCILGWMSHEGTVRVTILDDNGSPSGTVSANEKFVVPADVLTVSTLMGITGVPNSWTADIDGFWENVALKGADYFSWDPKNPNHLYFICDMNGSFIRRIEFDTKTVTTVRNVSTRHVSLNWSLSGDTLYVSRDAGIPEMCYAIRNGNFMNWTAFTLPTAVGNISSTDIHPVNGELYSSQWDGNFYRVNRKLNAEELLWNLGDGGATGSRHFKIIIHPTGNYAYLLLLQQFGIMKTEYDWATKKFKTPTTFAGTYTNGAAGEYLDGVGLAARFWRPAHGCFVYNPAYAGSADEYDFYVGDMLNHVIRKMTPAGEVSTFAGRYLQGGYNNGGYLDGSVEEARFHVPQGIIFDPVRGCFYVGDHYNNCIRKIGLVE